MSSICTGHCRCSMMAFAVIKEEYDEYNYLLQKIRARMESAEYPIFVTAGAGRQKLTHIMHNHYLTHSYESLCTADGSLVTFGFNFSKYDEHIIGAIKSCSQAETSSEALERVHRCLFRR